MQPGPVLTHKGCPAQTPTRRKTAAIWFALVTACLLPRAVAGVVTSSAERAAARRASGQAKAAAERAAMQKVLRSADENARRNIQRLFGKHLPDSGRNLPPARLLSRDDFDLHLQRHYPQLTAEERRQILGYYSNNQVTVNFNQQEFVLTMTHERLHQVAHPRFRETFGTELNEGVTERFAKLASGDLHLKDLPPVYTRESALADTLGARVGLDRLSQAYFKGEVGQVRSLLDADLGPGTYRRFVEATKQADLDLATRILMGR